MNKLGARSGLLQHNVMMTFSRILLFGLLVWAMVVFVGGLNPEIAWRRWLIVPIGLFIWRFAYDVLDGKDQAEVPVLILGSGAAMAAFKRAVQNHSISKDTLVYFDWEWPSSDGADPGEALKARVRALGIRKVVIAMENCRGVFPMQCLLNLRVEGVEILDAVTYYEKTFGKIWVESIRPSDLVFSDGFHRESLRRVSKRVMDILISLLGLVLAIPFFIFIPILIRLDSKGPVLYRQARVGEQGRSFLVLKFRSMFVDAEAATGPVWAGQNDPRITRLGKILRTLRLDELPQLINVLKGEMSFVGPRPERQVFIDLLKKKVPFYDLRHSVKPGLTGLAQVKYRYGASESDALEKHQYDLYYVKHLSPWIDLGIIFLTVRVVLRGLGAR